MRFLLSFSLTTLLSTAGVAMFCTTFTMDSAHAEDKNYSKQERNLAFIPKIRFHDKRLRRVYKVFAKQYKHMYGHASADGYIMPNELGELNIQRRQMKRLVMIDRRTKQAQTLFRKLKRKRKRKRTSEENEQLSLLGKRLATYENMIQRFACRHLQKYKKRHRKACAPKNFEHG